MSINFTGKEKLAKDVCEGVVKFVGVGAAGAGAAAGPAAVGAAVVAAAPFVAGAAAIVGVGALIVSAIKDE